MALIRQLTIMDKDNRASRQRLTGSQAHRLTKNLRACESFMNRTRNIEK